MHSILYGALVTSHARADSYKQHRFGGVLLCVSGILNVMLKDFYKDTIEISRWVTASRKKTQSVVATGIMAHIQPIQDTLNEASVARTFNEFLMFTQYQMIIGDKLVDQNSKKYEVIGVGKMEFRTGVRHYEATLKAI